MAYASDEQFFTLLIAELVRLFVTFAFGRLVRLAPTGTQFVRKSLLCLPMVVESSIFSYSSHKLCATKGVTHCTKLKREILKNVRNILGLFKRECSP